MKVKVKREVVMDATTILVDSYVRYWEDTDVNGQPDDGDTPKIPCAVKSADNGSYYWKPVIDIETGQILNWQQGVTANVYYKVCDDFACKVVEQKPTFPMAIPFPLSSAAKMMTVTAME